MMKFRDKKGFSLVELMIVVAIIAILAAIAIPSFLRFAMRSKTAEATSNLAGIRTGEEAYRSENDEYLAAPVPATPATTYPAAAPTAKGVMWVPNASGTFRTIGFAADGLVRYVYNVQVIAADAVAGTPPCFTATATGDLDDDNVNAIYVVSNDSVTPETRAGADGITAPNVYPKAVFSAAGDDF